MTGAEIPPRRAFRTLFRPLILSKAKRWYFNALLVVWMVAGLAAVIAGKFDFLWIPVLGIAGCTSVLMRDRTGRRIQEEAEGTAAGGR